MKSMKKLHKFDKIPNAKMMGKSSSMVNMKARKGKGIEIGTMKEMMDSMAKKANRKPGQDDKVEIVNTLLGINGSMKEFS